MQPKPTALRAQNQAGTRIRRVCEHDAAVFYVEPFRLARSPCKYCSPECRAAASKTGEWRVCEVDGRDFYVEQGELKRRASRWCSVACSRIVQRRGEFRKCRARGCPKTKYVQRGHLKKSPTYGWYCSPKCKGERIHELKYRGGPFRMYGSNWDAQRRLARKRDKYTCHDCGQKQGKLKLDVHHLRARRSFGRDYISANKLENLITLCRPCHIKWETAITHSGVRLKYDQLPVQLLQLSLSL